MTVDELLADPEIEIVVNLTTPQAHVPVALQALAAGKHVHSEKPLAIALAEARQLLDTIRPDGPRVGCAPDTFLGGGHQTARKLLDDGAIGEPVAGTATMMLRGHERWHPNPDLTCLVNLLGPIRAVCGRAKATFAERTIATGPRAGETVRVEVPTHITGILEFADGATVNMTTSFDVWQHGHSPIEIYGTEGSMIVPDPNMFGGGLRIAHRRDEWRNVAPLYAHAEGQQRGIGVADLAHAIRSGRPHRASHALAYHVLEVMEAFGRSADSDTMVEIKSRCDRPAQLPTGLPPGRLERPTEGTDDDERGFDCLGRLGRPYARAECRGGRRHAEGRRLPRRCREHHRGVRRPRDPGFEPDRAGHHDVDHRA